MFSRGDLRPVSGNERNALEFHSVVSGILPAFSVVLTMERLLFHLGSANLYGVKREASHLREHHLRPTG